jgi:XTP/dITP diphosphohydrolase
MKENVNFVTTNSYKFEVAQKFFQTLPKDKFTLVQYDIDTPEIQNESVEAIARQSAIWVSRQIGELAVASDVGFYINALGGFPGPFVKYANKWLRPNDVLNTMRSHEDRSAYFIDALALASPDGTCDVFTTKTNGIIINDESMPDTKWTMDAIFVPDGHSKTLTAMDEEENNSVWDDEAWHQLVAKLEQRNRND